MPVVTVPEGSTVQEHEAEIAGLFDAVRAAAPQLRVVDLGSTGDDGFVTDDGRSTFALIQGPEPTGFGPGIETQVLPAVQQAAGAAGFEVGSPPTCCWPRAGTPRDPACWPRPSSAPWAPCWC